MFKYKLIALDLDGTLLDNNQEIAEKNLHWIK
ncbi:MAG TPA: phosphoglycolate phosphatase, partial [Firmicutes bacterium]|nr:phosphoglycolate phosphatase [Bacillota bacterium]